MKVGLVLSLILFLATGAISEIDANEIIKVANGVNRVTEIYTERAKIKEAYYTVTGTEENGYSLEIFGVYEFGNDSCIPEPSELFTHVEYPRLTHNQFDLFFSYSIEKWRGCEDYAVNPRPVRTIRVFSSGSGNTKSGIEYFEKPGIFVNGMQAKRRELK